MPDRNVTGIYGEKARGRMVRNPGEGQSYQEMTSRSEEVKVSAET